MINNVTVQQNCTRLLFCSCSSSVHKSAYQVQESALCNTYYCASAARRSDSVCTFSRRISRSLIIIICVFRNYTFGCLHRMGIIGCFFLGVWLKMQFWMVVHLHTLARTSQITHYGSAGRLNYDASHLARWRKERVRRYPRRWFPGYLRHRVRCPIVPRIPNPRHAVRDAFPDTRGHKSHTRSPPGYF